MPASDYRLASSAMGRLLVGLACRGSQNALNTRVISQMDDILQRITADQADAGEACQLPATDAQIDRLIDDLERAFGANLPKAVQAFLMRANGLDYNGLVLYGASQTEAARGPGGFWQGMVPANALWREAVGCENILVIGETDMDLVTVALDGTQPCLRDKISNDETEGFDSVEQMLGALMLTRL